MSRDTHLKEGLRGIERLMADLRSALQGMVIQAREQGVEERITLCGLVWELTLLCLEAGVTTDAIRSAVANAERAAAGRGEEGSQAGRES